MTTVTTDSQASAEPTAVLLPSRVLVAEDQPAVAASLAEDLKALQIEVIGPAANGEAALQLAGERPPDLALLDIRMPVIDGLAAASMLWSKMNVPSVMVSAFTDTGDLAACTRIGVYGYVLKPTSPDELRVSLAVAWARFREREQLVRQVRELEAKLEARKVIERAKGQLMQRMNLSEDQAMKLLQKHARSSRRKVVDLARAVLETSELLKHL